MNEFFLFVLLSIFQILAQINSFCLKTFGPFSKQKRLVFTFHLHLICLLLYFLKQRPQKALLNLFSLNLFGLLKFGEYLRQLLLNSNKIFRFYFYEILSDHVLEVCLLYLNFYFQKANQQEQNQAINLIKLPFYHPQRLIFSPSEKIQ